MTLVGGTVVTVVVVPPITVVVVVITVVAVMVVVVVATVVVVVVVVMPVVVVVVVVPLHTLAAPVVIFEQIPFDPMKPLLLLLKHMGSGIPSSSQSRNAYTAAEKPLTEGEHQFEGLVHGGLQHPDEVHVLGFPGHLMLAPLLRGMFPEQPEKELQFD